ncbi:epsin-2 [Exaiptasia diaphana]|uniref:ENTH domain-containing protein n=1 Tax=Exaiptasia diaphana TaxID=2652724 RepID=A0A913X6F6_EXADI|nr:epsin-2 [Exaiptasia diaphana]KXJ28573.1 Epsin-2 [Exaiptasia diaphana]
MSVRRQIKNVVNNYSNSEVKVREATSNDPWGPSSSLMSEIADATYNVVAFSEIMAMIWKRLNDHGKNWRHVYKALVLLDYIIKTGSERVAQQCRENIFVIQTLKDFQFIDKDGKDQGMNVREKAKQLVALLKDEERLKNERQRALKAKERFAQASGGIGSDSVRGGRLKNESGGSLSDIRQTALPDSSLPTSRSWEPERKNTTSDLENCRPANANEEELQLQLALALSKQEADEHKHLDESDNERLKMAISQSKSDTSTSLFDSSPAMVAAGGPTADPWGTPQPMQVSDPWGSSSAPVSQQSSNLWETPPVPSADPWGGSSTTTQVSSAAFVSSAPSDPWGAPSQPPPPADPWGAPTQPQPQPQAQNPWSSTNGQSVSAGFDPFSQPVPIDAQSSSYSTTANDPFSMTGVTTSLPTNQEKKPDDFLGGELPKNLVDLDLLASKPNPTPNPFVAQTEQSKTNNPFLADRPQQPTLNQLRQQNMAPPMASGGGGATFGGDNILLPAPLLPNSSSGTQANNTNNPFM